MKKTGKSINIFLVDGSPSGLIKCTMANWTGITYKIPRTDLDICKDREDLSRSGVYFLFGADDETGECVVYIGQAGSRKNGEGLLNRLKEHKKNPDKDYWTEAVVFTTSNDSFGPTEISYLENRFCQMAKETKRYMVKNNLNPTAGNVTEEKESELEEFIEYAKILIGALGHKIFEPIIKNTDISANSSNQIPEDSNEQVFCFETASVKATGRRTSEGFVLFKGSRITEDLKNSCPENVVNYRKRYAEKVENNILTEDILLTSPSAAACFVSGSSTSGNIVWKNKEGRSLKEVEGEDV